jgi:glycerol uptake facilitator-like aquaporin
MSLTRRLVGEATGTAFLLATIVGSGIMAERLAGGNEALALLCNSTATGAILVVLIVVFAPISGAHLNPAVTMAFLFRREMGFLLALAYIASQIFGAVIGTWTAHLMFDQSILQISTKARMSSGIWLAEAIATFGLILTIFGTRQWRAEGVAVTVGLYIASAYWFTASTSFANPAVTIARSLTDSFAGIQPWHVPAFIIAQTGGALVGTVLTTWLFASPKAALSGSVSSIKVAAETRPT